MTQPLVSFKQDKALPKAAANLLPCRVHYNGPLDEVTPYWTPSKENGSTNTAYFRGRKLHGQTIKIPDQYRGVVAESVPNKVTQNLPGLESKQEEGEDQKIESRKMEVTAEFDEIIVWGHEALANAEEDPYIRSMDEWLQVAEQIHSYDREDQGTRSDK